MIEFDVDMGYLLEAGELDCVVLNDENGEHEPVRFAPEWTCEDSSTIHGLFVCSECGCSVLEEAVDFGGIHFCPDCGKWVER